jgi:hypothetical protein
MTRRQLGAAILAATAIADAAQTPPSEPSGPAAELQAARDRNQRTAETLATNWAKVELPMAVEPAFHFTA